MRRINLTWLWVVIPFSLSVALIAEPAAADQSVVLGLFNINSGPSTYQECLEKYVKPVHNKNVAKHLKNTCVAEFLIKRNDKASLDYYDCVREGLDDVKTNFSAISIVNGCRIINSQ